jgi:hypothetical protein
MIAWATDPRAELTMVASAVAMNNAFAEAPECPPANDFGHRVGHAGQAGTGDDDHQAEQQRAFGADPAGHHTGDELATPITAM